MKIYFFLILAILFWSGNFILGRFVHADIDPMTLSLFRWSIVLVLLSPYIFVKRVNIFSAIRNNFLILFILGVLGISGFNTVLYYGLQYTTATNSLLINSSIPLIIILLNFFIFKSPLSKYQFLGIILSTIGVIFLVIKGDVSNLLNLEFNKGDFLIIVSSLIWALYSILIKYKPKDLNPFEFISAITLLGVIVLFIVYYSTGHSLHLSSFIYDVKIYYVVLYMAIFPSLLSFYFWNKGIFEIGANKTGQFTHIMPIFGIFLAYFILNESIEIYHLYGILLIGMGIYTSLFYKKEKTISTKG